MIMKFLIYKKFIIFIIISFYIVHEMNQTTWAATNFFILVYLTADKNLTHKVFDLHSCHSVAAFFSIPKFIFSLKQEMKITDVSTKNSTNNWVYHDFKLIQITLSSATRSR